MTLLFCRTAYAKMATDITLLGRDPTPWEKPKSMSQGYRKGKKPWALIKRSDAYAMRTTPKNTNKLKTFANQRKKHSQLQLLLMEKRCADLQTAFWNPWSETETASWPTLTKTETASWSETETASWTPWSETETAFWTTLSESETASCHSMAGHG